MSIAVRYYSQSNHTENLTKAAADALGLEALPVSEPLEEPVDKLILGSSPYKFTIDEHVKTFLTENANKIGTIYLISCPALYTSSVKHIKEFCTPLGLTVSDNDFHCRGEFLTFHKGKPDAADLENCAKWALRTFKD